MVSQLSTQKGRNNSVGGSSVGSLTLYQGALQGLILMPLDALKPVMQMLIAERFKYVIIQGARLRYRKTIIHHYRLERGLDEDDLLVDE